ncbi:MAG: class A beta-lactamase-related serine hydrolase, partial [Massilia sp.]
MIAELSMAYVCLHVGFKLCEPGDRRPPSVTGFHALLQFMPLLCGIVLGLASVAVAASPLPDHAAGAGAGSPRPPAERLQHLDGFLQQATGAKGYLGAVSLVWRDGKVVQSGAYGYRDLARTQPMKEDSIFRIYSMTKTVTTVAALILVEQGKLSLDDPVENRLPEFAGLQVFDGGTADQPRLRPAKVKVTLRQLLTHTSGFATAGGEARGMG